jgi:hypothetical protein
VGSEICGVWDGEAWTALNHARSRGVRRFVYRLFLCFSSSLSFSCWNGNLVMMSNSNDFLVKCFEFRPKSKARTKICITVVAVPFSLI